MCVCVCVYVCVCLCVCVFVRVWIIFGLAPLLQTRRTIVRLNLPLTIASLDLPTMMKTLVVRFNYVVL